LAVTPQVVNGWTLYAHPLCSAQYEALAQRVMQLKEKDPIGYIKKNEAKRFAVIHKLIFEVIPKDPTLADYRQGSTLGDQYKHWFRAKFFQQYRLFFRFHKPSKTIVYGWVNDEKNKRAYGSKTDAYRVFGKMLKSGHPPDDWDSLLAEAKVHSKQH
jgi:toxin YhaV